MSKSASTELQLLKEELGKLSRGRVVVGWEKIIHRQHAVLVITAIRAFGDDPRASFYIEQRTGLGNMPRPDLILLHPEVGVLIIENKGVKISEIQSVQGTTLSVLRDGGFKNEDPFHQSEKVLFRLHDMAKKRCDLNEVLFLHTAALPRIARSDFETHFKSSWPNETLFKDACTNPAVFRSQVLAYSQVRQRDAKRKVKLSKRASDAVRMILDGKSYLHAPRSIYVENANINLIGMQVQELELGLKSPTMMQREYGQADMRGQHRLFRGVAGSGKSILLSLSAAQTVARFASETTELFSPDKPRKRVLAVCYNRTLVHHLKQIIDDRYGRLTWEQVPQDMLSVVHFEGLVSSLEKQEPHLATGLSYKEKSERAKLLIKKFDSLDATRQHNLGFDAVYVDEAQDLLPDEISMLFRLARKDSMGQQTFIVFYDNAQNIYGNTLPVWEKLGVNFVGGRTVFLDQCLRNTHETLSLAFNVLVGSFAPEGERVTTRTFADVASLRQRGLIAENKGRFELSFAPRHGPPPTVTVYRTRSEEIHGVVTEIQKLIHEHRVIPSDILVLYKFHHLCNDMLKPALAKVLDGDQRIHEVRSDDPQSKARRLIEDGILTLSTVASAKGYDAPIVFFIGIDRLTTDTNARAAFYVGATRAKLMMKLSGISCNTPTLLDEVVNAAKVLGPAENVLIAKQESFESRFTCQHCQGKRVHAQYGKFGYFLKCISCTKTTSIHAVCPSCSRKQRIRKEGQKFYAECEVCKQSTLMHVNESLIDIVE